MSDEFKDVEILLEGLDENNISSVLSKWKDVNDVQKKLVELEEMLETKIKLYLKERRWEKYSDKDTNISVTISTQKSEDIDKKQLLVMLTDAQLAQVTRTKTFEKMVIITPETRERLKKYVRKN